MSGLHRKYNRCCQESTSSIVSEKLKLISSWPLLIKPLNRLSVFQHYPSFGNLESLGEIVGRL